MSREERKYHFGKLSSMQRNAQPVIANSEAASKMIAETKKRFAAYCLLPTAF
jgi:hypothetical protein